MNSELNPEGEEKLNHSSELDFNGRNILLVEDSDMNQMIACEILNDAGFIVDVCGNGLEAIEAVQKKSYEVVLMDIQMPLMGGFEATTNIRALGDDYVELPIIAMTGHVEIADKEKFLFSDHIIKPFYPDELLLILSKWIIHN